MGGATRIGKRIPTRNHISIHAPRGGSDSKYPDSNKHTEYFNPRSPWGERPGNKLHYGQHQDFNPRSPWGERPRVIEVQKILSGISIHAPRGGSDAGKYRQAALPCKISIHAPRGGSDTINGQFRKIAVISIHAPRGGSDVLQSRIRVTHAKISIHAPHGGSDYSRCVMSYSVGISIHAPRGGSDRHNENRLEPTSHFNPRSPWGERLSLRNLPTVLLLFQSTLPVGGATQYT